MTLSRYKQLLTPIRQRTSTYADQNRTLAVETESDRGRIIFSNAFRRLQQKAQVFPLESNAAVRTRLTHSLEVAHTGRYLSQKIIEKLPQYFSDYQRSWLSKNEQAFLNIVESACLIHDIGNPPFGHFGEAAIRDWFKYSGQTIAKEALKNSSNISKYLSTEFKDFVAFDGNAQGLRVITKLQGDDGRTGLNLTFPLIASYMKYGCPPQDSLLGGGDGPYKKPGYFNTEKTLINTIRDALDLEQNARHPLSYVMEAADDIAYCLSDIEDGIEKNLLTEDTLFFSLEQAWQDLCDLQPDQGSGFIPRLIQNAGNSPSVGRYTIFKTSLINHLVEYAADQYCKNHRDILTGTADGLIRGKTKEQTALKAVRKVVGDTIFRSDEAEGVELAGYSVIRGLLEEFSATLSLPKDQFSILFSGDSEAIRKGGMDYEWRLLNRISAKARRAYEIATQEKDTCDVQEWHLRAHMLVDYISGMTDDYALQTYQLLAGIKVAAR